MAYILRKLAGIYVHLNDELSDPRTQDWFLMRGPIPGLALLGTYLYLVFRYLPGYMSTRKPYDLKKVIALYNAFQIFACAYIVIQALYLGWATDYSFICQSIDFSDSPKALDYAYKVCYFYFLVKLIDLADTIFFLLRKKQNQVSFLHVYHHAGMCILAWSYVKWIPGGHGTLFVPINSFVHIIMYSYYLLTVWDESYKKSIWWKKQVTHLQLIQFTILIIHYSLLFVLPNCNYPVFVAYILVPQNLFMLILFGDFYYKTYIKKNNKKSISCGKMILNNESQQKYSAWYDANYKFIDFGENTKVKDNTRFNTPKYPYIWSKVYNSPTRKYKQNKIDETSNTHIELEPNNGDHNIIVECNEDGEIVEETKIEITALEDERKTNKNFLRRIKAVFDKFCCFKDSSSR